MNLIQNMMMTTTANKRIGRLALEAVLVEVSVTPKPGLVDRNNSGAHDDMDFLTFMKSAAALRSCFEECAHVAGYFTLTHKTLFPELRRIGLETEAAMFEATGGINTHKGEIFSLGILSGCAGLLAASNEPLEAERILNLASGVYGEFFHLDFMRTKAKSPELLTKGERAWLAHGITGARGQAEAGYPIVRETGLPALKKYLAEGQDLNNALAFTLIHIMAVNFDTNIISRHDLATVQEVMNTSRRLIDDGLSIPKIARLDEEFTARNISPSGSADLLAVTYFIHALTQSSPNS